jgi:hypothetical protein
MTFRRNCVSGRVGRSLACATPMCPVCRESRARPQYGVEDVTLCGRRCVGPLQWTGSSGADVATCGLDGHQSLSTICLPAHKIAFRECVGDETTNGRVIINHKRACGSASDPRPKSRPAHARGRSIVWQAAEHDVMGVQVLDREAVRDPADSAAMSFATGATRGRCTAISPQYWRKASARLHISVEVGLIPRRD